MITAIRRLLKELFYDGKATLSLTRTMIFLVFAQVTAIVWLCVFWVRHLTLTGQMEQGALLASAVFGGVAGVLGTQVAGAAFSYFVQNKFGSGGIAGRQLDIDEARTEIIAADAEMGMSSPPGLVPDVGYLVPSDQSEPRVAAESGNPAASPAATLTVADPIAVEIVPTSEEEVTTDEHSSRER